VGHGQHRARVRGEVALQPLHALRVEVVGGLVEQQQSGLLQQQLAQGDAAALASGQVVDELVGGRAPQGIHRLVQPGVEVPGAGVVEVGLQVAHLRQELVVVRLRVGQLLADRVEPLELALDVATASSTFWSTVLPSVSGGSCWSIPRSRPGPGSRRRCSAGRGQP
jgi:hypothetical protein